LIAHALFIGPARAQVEAALLAPPRLDLAVWRRQRAGQSRKIAMGLASKTPIAVPGGAKAIDAFEIGDPVLAASLAGGRLLWSTQTVEFSTGTAPGSQNNMVSVVCADQEAIIATLDQPFLVTGNKLKRAAQLIPGEMLVSQTGAPVEVVQVSIGRFDGGIWEIATSRIPTRDPNNHLIAANGLVVGDYALQVGALDSGQT